MRGHLHLACCANTVLLSSDFPQSGLIRFPLICPESSKHPTPHIFKHLWASYSRTSPFGAHCKIIPHFYSSLFHWLSIFIRSPVDTCCAASAALSPAMLTSQSCAGDFDWWYFCQFPACDSWQAKLCQMSGCLLLRNITSARRLWQMTACSALFNWSLDFFTPLFDHRPQRLLTSIIWMLGQ